LQLDFLEQTLSSPTKPQVQQFDGYALHSSTTDNSTQPVTNEEADFEIEELVSDPEMVQKNLRLSLLSFNLKLHSLGSL
jgi:hypothetical protein